MFESRISAGASEKLPGWENLTQKTVAWSYDVKGHDRICQAGYQKSCSFSKFQVLAWMITSSRRKNLNQLENYQKYAHKLS